MFKRLAYIIGLIKSIPFDFLSQGQNMILVTDVQYAEDTALAAGILFNQWDEDIIEKKVVKHIIGVNPYEPGAFYKRELPCLLSLLAEIDEPLEAIIVDGFVTLGGDKDKGLGMHLYDSLGQSTPIIGVAKKSFIGTPKKCEIFRGDSEKPLYITTAGISLLEAKALVTSMKGIYRIPTLLKNADQLCRGIIS